MANNYMALTTAISKNEEFKAAIRAIVEDPKAAAEQSKNAAAAVEETLVKVAKGLKATAKKDKAEKAPAAKKAPKKAAAKKEKAEKPAKEKPAKKAPKKAAKKKK